MFNIFRKILSILCIFLGEGMAIYSEVIAAKNAYNIRIIWWSFFWVTIAGIFLIPGYVYGIRFFNNIWTVSVVSIVSILICEPIVVYLIFGEIPTRGPILGFLFGLVGFCCILFID